MATRKKAPRKYTPKKSRAQEASEKKQMFKALQISFQELEVLSPANQRKVLNALDGLLS